MAGAVDARDALAFLQAAIARAPAAENVEVLQREADGIKLGVAGGARLFDFVCSASRSRMVFAPRMSGSTAGTLGGGGGGGWPMSRSMTQAPRTTGEVVVPFALTFKIAACVSRPPKGLPAGSATLRMAEPLSGGSS